MVARVRKVAAVRRATATVRPLQFYGGGNAMAKEIASASRFQPLLTPLLAMRFEIE
jgi:hypothetical protein